MQIFFEKFIKKYFSMVEVALAIGILAVGAATVVTLFPVGIKQTRDSIGQNYSAIFVDDTYSYFSGLAKQDWSSITALHTYSDVFISSNTPVKVISTTAGYTKISGTDIFSIYPDNGAYAISKSTTSRPGNEEDYTAQVLIWRNTGTPVAGTNGVGINVEISWPLSQPNYSKRSNLEMPQ